jgi:hypothetical protein
MRPNRVRPLDRPGAQGRPGPLGRLCLLGLLLPLVPGSALGQEIRGRVMELETDEPLAAAVISAAALDSTLLAMGTSDASGNFLVRLRTPAPDGFFLRVDRLGYQAVESMPLSMVATDTLRLEVRLRPLPIELEGITAAAAMRMNRHLGGFVQRQRDGFGRYLGPDRIAEIKPVETLQVLHAVSPKFFLRDNQLMVHHASGLSAWCPPAVFLDGIQIHRGPGDLGVRINGEVAASSVRAVEVYHRPYQAPVQFQMPFLPDCPVVVIWTDYALGLDRLGGVEVWSRPQN